jgi:hypothetical protein
LSACAASEAHTGFTAGNRSSARSNSMRAASPRSVVLMPHHQLDSAELVIKTQGRHLDGDVGNSGRMWRGASAERFEIGQSSGIELGIDSLGEFGFTGAVVSQRQQPDNRRRRRDHAADAERSGP